MDSLRWISVILIVIIVLLLFVVLIQRFSTSYVSQPLDRATAASYCEIRGAQLVSLAAALRLPKPDTPRWIRNDLTGQLQVYHPSDESVRLGEADGDRWSAWCQ